MRCRIGILAVALLACVAALGSWQGGAVSATEDGASPQEDWVALAGVRDEGRYWIRLDRVDWVQEKDGSLYVAFASVGSEPLIIQANPENRKALGVE